MLKRNAKNPILTREDIPNIKPNVIDVSSVFNPGAIKSNDEYILLLRVQNRGRETFIMKAYGSDGVNFKVEKAIVYFKGIEKVKKKIYHIHHGVAPHFAGSDIYQAGIALHNSNNPSIVLFRGKYKMNIRNDGRVWKSEITK